MSLLTKFRGDSAALPPRAAGKAMVLALIGGFLAIATTALLAQSLHVALVLGRLGRAVCSCLAILMCPSVSRGIASSVMCSARSSG